nr:reverse transcriptase domain-containing protein [Tanacetum cinerariifolium]
PTIPTTSSSPVVECETEATKDTVHPTNDRVCTPRPNQRPSIPYPSILQDQKLHDKANDQREKFFQIFKDLNFNISFVDALILMPKFGPSIKSLLTNKDKLCELARTPLNEHCSVVLLKKLPKKVGDPGKFLILAHRSFDFSPGWGCQRCLRQSGYISFPDDFVVIDFDVDPRVPLILERSFLKTERALIDVFEGELTLRVGKEAITFNLHQISRYSANYNDMTTNCIGVIKMACEEYSQVVLGFSDVIASGNPTPYYDLIVSTTSPTLTPFGNSDFLLEEVDAFLAVEDDPTSPEVEQSYIDTEGDILLLEAFLNDDPLLPPSNQGNYLPERLNSKTYLPISNTHFWCDDKLPGIISKDLSVEEKTALIMILKSHKRAINWKLFDIKGVDPEFCAHKILMEEDFEPAVQHQRRVNPKIYDVIKNEVLKLLDAGLIYPISDSPSVSPVYCVPEKGGFTVVENELILTRLVTGWSVCIDYRKLNEATRKDHFPLPFMDQMLERLAGNRYYYFLNEGIDVDKAKVDVITKLPHPTTVKGICSFLGHADFYQRFIKDFSKIARPMTRLLEKDTPFLFSKECVEAFQTFKRNLTEAPILIAPDWDMPFELMCDASDFAIGAVLGQHQEKHYRPIHYASKTMTEKDSKARLLRWVLLLQEFTFLDTKEAENVAADHLSLLENPHQNVLDPKEINESFSLETLNFISTRGENRASWSDKLDDALWAFRIAYKNTKWALKHANFDLQTTGDHKKFLVNELNELRNQAYENSLIYKEKTKRLHDSKIKDRVFNIGDRVLLFNSRLKILSGKLKSRWSGPFTISHVFPYGIVELSQPDGPNFKVNGHILKHYFGEDVPKMVVPDLQTIPKDQ